MFASLMYMIRIRNFSVFRSDRTRNDEKETKRIWSVNPRYLGTTYLPSVIDSSHRNVISSIPVR